MIRKFHIWLFGFYCIWLDDMQADFKNDFIYKVIQIITFLIISILPYVFVRFTWFRIMVYFVEDYAKYMPINLIDLLNKADLNTEDWHIRETYEVEQLDQ